MRLASIKKVVVLFIAALSVSIVSVSSLKAASAAGGSADSAAMIALLQQIAQNTNGILSNVNGLQGILANLYQATQGWVTADDSPQTAQIQALFTTFGNQLITDLTAQNQLQAGGGGLNAAILTTAATTSTLPNANDLVYSTILGSPFYPVKSDPRNKNGNHLDLHAMAQNYILNASAGSINHLIPNPSWQGKTISRTRYQNYYNIARSVETYGAYVLSNQLVDGNQLNDLQTQLIKQATDPKNWFAQVSSEKIGWVLRQILMYQSQTYVLLTQMLQYQKQMVTAQVMTNGVLIAANQQNESSWVAYAQGVQPVF